MIWIPDNVFFISVKVKVVDSKNHLWQIKPLKWFKNPIDDVMTANLIFLNTALSLVWFICKCLQIDILCFSAHCFVWDLKLVYSIDIFYQIWLPKKITENCLNKKFGNLKNKTSIHIDFGLLLTYMTIFRLSVA